MNDRETIYLDKGTSRTKDNRCLIACSIHNKNETINFILSYKVYYKIIYQEILKPNIYYKGYEFFKDFQGIIRYDKIEPILTRWEILDL